MYGRYLAATEVPLFSEETRLASHGRDSPTLGRTILNLNGRCCRAPKSLRGPLLKALTLKPRGTVLDFNFNNQTPVVPIQYF